MDEITFSYETTETLTQYEGPFQVLLATTKKVVVLEKPLSMSVNFISSSAAAALNAEYRGKDYVADVISFPIDDEYGIYDQLEIREIGDIFICFEEAQKKAQKMHHNIDTEMAWLFVHGLLHILGYDHEQNEADAKIMFDLTDTILAQHNMKYEME